MFENNIGKIIPVRMAGLARLPRSETVLICFHAVMAHTGFALTTCGWSCYLPTRFCIVLSLLEFIFTIT